MANIYSDYLQRLNFTNVLKPKQLEILEFIRNGGKDVVGILPTGYGKSLVYQVLPLMLDGTVLVFSPLSVIQQDQLEQLSETDLKCCILNTQGRVVKNVDFEEEFIDISSNVPLPEVQSCNLIFVHPEALFSTLEGRELLQCESFVGKVKAVVIDECHKVDEWGKSFRKDFQRLKEISAYFPGVPRIALSATITVEEEGNIIKSLGMLGAKVVKESPDRENIFLDIKLKDKSGDMYETYFEIYQPLCDDLLVKGTTFPVTLVYMPLSYIGDASAYCKYIFKEKNPTLETCTYGMMCSGQDPDVKSVIISELSKHVPRIRLVFCTSVIGMGFNSPSIERIVHCKPPRNLPDYVQEIGRAGRSGQAAEAVMYFCNMDISANVKDLKKDIIDYCKSDKCLRDNLLEKFGFKRTSVYSHKCCSYCKSVCHCFECEMFRIEI